LERKDTILLVVEVFRGNFVFKRKCITMVKSLFRFAEDGLNHLGKMFVPTWVVMNIDLFLGLVAIFAAYLLRFNFNIPFATFPNISLAIGLYLFVRILALQLFGTNKMYIRYTSMKDLVRLVMAIFTGNSLFFAINYTYFLLTGRGIIPISIIIIDFFIAAYLLIAFRIFAKYFIHNFKRSGGKAPTNVLLYGREHFAVSLKRALESDKESNYRVVGFIHHQSKNFNKTIEGLSVFDISELDNLISLYSVAQLIFVDNDIPAEYKNVVVQRSLNRGVRVKTINNFIELTADNPRLPRIDEIKIEDLLERDPIRLDIQKIASSLKGKTILVTGAAGSIGSEIVRQVFSFSPSKLILLDQAETPIYFVDLELRGRYPHRTDQIDVVIADITDHLRMRQLFESQQIDVVFHAAAYKHVPLMENNPKEAIKNNIFGTRMLADLSMEFGVEKFVMISTDKAVNPTNIMGATKRVAEIYTQSLDGLTRTQFITTRFGNVLGSNGSVIPLFKKQIETGGPVTVTHPDVTRYFMTIPEACQLVLEASVMGHGGEIFIFDMGKSVKIIDLAKNMIRLAGFKVGKDIQIIFTGLRPGEKLYEELLNNGENTLPTYHSKIMKASVIKMDHVSIAKHLHDLQCKLAEDVDNFVLVSKLKDIVPEFLSQNSVYIILDREPQVERSSKLKRSAVVIAESTTGE